MVSGPSKDVARQSVDEDQAIGGDDRTVAGVAPSLGQSFGGVDTAGSRDVEAKRDLLAGAAESRIDVSARRGQDPVAARRLKERAESRARLDAMAMGTRVKGFKTLTSGEVARQARAAAARRQAQALAVSGSSGSTLHDNIGSAGSTQGHSTVRQSSLSRCSRCLHRT